jgi:hypothetical protein
MIRIRYKRWRGGQERKIAWLPYTFGDIAIGCALYVRDRWVRP